MEKITSTFSVHRSIFVDKEKLLEAIPSLKMVKPEQLGSYILSIGNAAMEEELRWNLSEEDFSMWEINCQGVACQHIE